MKQFNKGWLLFGAALILLLLPCLAAAQEQTGNIQGVVKDRSGAVIPGVEISATSAQRTITAISDEIGYYRFMNLLPGTYVVSAKMTGFQPVTREDVTVQLGRTLQVNFDLSPAGTAVTVTVTGGQEPIVDVTSSKTATSISENQIDMMAKGLGFSSVIELAPGTRDEAKSGGYQIDGASGSENVFIVDGVEVTRIVSGTLGSTKNVPLEFVKEVQVKSAGYEAEFGGSTGGVVNVVTKGGTNDVHGEIRLEYTSDTWRGHDNPTLRFSPYDPTQKTAENFFNPYGKDKTRFLNPNYSLSGPIIKDKLWFFGAYAPQYNRTTQRTQLIRPIAAGDTSTTVLNERLFDYKTRSDYAVGRLDYAASTKLSLFASYNWSPFKSEGSNTGAPPVGMQTVSQTAFDYPRYGFQGGYTPSWQISFGANYAVTPKFILAFRGGKTYLNDKGGSYDVPNGVQDNRVSAACSVSQYGSCPAGTTAIGNINLATGNTLTQYDITTRWNLNGDATYIVKLFGQQHILRGGYQTNLLGNDVLYGTSAPRLNLYYGGSYLGKSGPYGYYATYFFSRQGNVSSSNQGFFIQDQWQIHKRVTLNVGLRLEKEYIPAYPITAAGHPDLSPDLLKMGNTNPINFGWGDKLAPRIGGAWDVFGNNKLKVSGSYSVFYDTMKYELPRGSFGGEIYLREWRTLDVLDYTTIKLPLPFGTGGPGTIIRGPIDYRYPSNVWEAGSRPGIDPNLMPMKEHEYSGTVEYAFTPTLMLSGRFTRKALDHAIEDVGGTDSKGNEVYTIGNPGFGATVDFFDPATPKAVREYTGFEARLDKRFSKNWYANVAWVNSKLYGNYGGLASSDEDGRNSPDVNRYFDLPELVYDTHGHQVLGRLATDRPNTVKIFAAYVFNYKLAGKSMETQVGLNQRLYQGIPIQTKLREDTGNGGDYIYPEGRGDMGRTPFFSQSDIVFTHFWKVSENSKVRVAFNVTNLFDQRTANNIYPNYINENFSGPLQYDGLQDLLTSNGDWKARAAAQGKVLNVLYGRASGWQAPRELRWSFGFQF
ncbi:MAG TPA: TonB-dependent receptor [Acidobacteriota bacterium]|nr:TonB-dependent receptor [Acidobacteriota bacterium]